MPVFIDLVTEMNDDMRRRMIDRDACNEARN
jgi:hypothetical protein